MAAAATGQLLAGMEAPCGAGRPRAAAGHCRRGGGLAGGSGEVGRRELAWAPGRRGGGAPCLTAGARRRGLESRLPAELDRGLRSACAVEEQVDHPIPITYARSGRTVASDRARPQQLTSSSSAPEKPADCSGSGLSSVEHRAAIEWLLSSELSGIGGVEKLAEGPIAKDGKVLVVSRQGVGPDGAGEGGGHSRLLSRLLGAVPVSPRVRGLALLNLLTLLYGSNISIVKEAQGFLDPAMFSTGRFAIATLAFLPFLRRAFADKQIRTAGAELGIWGGLGYLTQAFGLVSTAAGRASFISTFTVIEVPIIAGLFGAHIPKITWVAAASAVLGVGLLETADGHSSPWGDTWTFASALFFGLHVLRSEHHSKHLDKAAAVPLIGMQLLIITMCSASWALIDSLQPDLGTLRAALPMDWGEIVAYALRVPWPAMIYTGLLSTAFCLWIEVVSLRDLSATEAAMVYTLEPLYGAGFAWWLLGDRWGLKGWAGASLILGGSLAMQLFGHRRPEGTGGNSGQGFSTRAAAAALAAAAVATAAAAADKSSLSAEEATQQALMIADSVDLEDVAAFLNIYALTKLNMESKENARQSHGEANSCR